MASISNDPNGRRRILFVGADGKRRTIRLGKASKRYAESVRVKVEDLVSASITAHAPADETSRWLSGLDDVMLAKLVRSGLVKPRRVATLGGFTRRYIDSRTDVKPSTHTNLERSRKYLLELFDGNRPMRDFTPGDADDFRRHMIESGRAENTTRRAIGRARQFFADAQKRGLVHSNPFAGLAASVKPTPEKFYFVSLEETHRMLEACPDEQWRLIIALARYGGLRCPSEVLALSWADVNWEHGRIHVPSPKTGRRMIPLFPELLPNLREAFEAAEPGTAHVITRYRDTNANLRTQLHRIIRQAGLEPWVKPFQNMRSTRETELVEHYPEHVACKWIGNSKPVAAQHYLQLTDEHFDRAIRGEHVPDSKAAQNPAQKAHATSRNARNESQPDDSQPFDDARGYDSFPVGAEPCEAAKVPVRGLEPLPSCEDRHLKTARLPISPHGRVV